MQLKRHTVLRVVLDTDAVASAILWGGARATPRIAPDSDDDAVIGNAPAAKAESVVSGDKPPLTVIEHEGERFVGVAQTIGVIDARFKT